MTPNGAICRDKNRRCILQRRKRTEKEQPHREKRKTNYALIDYIQMGELLGSGKGDTEGILNEWKEVRVADNCVQTLLKIQTLRIRAHQLAEGNSTPRFISNRRTQSEHRSSRKMKLGRPLISTEIYPCAKRSFVTLDTIRKIRTGQMGIRGQARKKHTASYDEERAEGEVEFICGEI